MSCDFAHRMTCHPLPHDPEAGALARAAFAGLDTALLDLLSGTAGCSPYLRGLMTREGDWLREALAQAPETALQTVLQGLEATPPDALAVTLRQAKRRVALLVALADLGGVWELEAVTGALTALADAAVRLCLRALVAEQIRRGKLPGARPDDVETAAGMTVLAMGKLGAGELNYSSDIDLICLFDDSRYPGAEQEARAAFIKVTRRMMALLSDITGDGYVFRTDLRLRPDAAVMPVCLSMAAAESYYESVGRTWERAAYIKARPCAGDLGAGERFLKALVPFVWRRHLDFAAIQDAHDMRLRIRDHRRLHGPLAVEGHNLKLGHGGIREIEFFTQTRQLIAGGRDPSLRAKATVPGLMALAAKGWLPDEVATGLTAAYRAHRRIEHRLQMVNDAQTHTLPGTREGIARIASFCGESDVAAFRADLLARLSAVNGLTEGFFAPGPAETGPELSRPAQAIVTGWNSYPALRSDRAQTIFRRLGPVLLKRLQRAANPDQALIALDGFLAGLPAGIQLFALFEANPTLVDLIVDIAATAPGLARYLSHNSGVLDAVIGGSFFAPWPGCPALSADLAARLAEAQDYEHKLDTARRWMKELHFRIGVHHLRGLVTADQAAGEYSDLAEAVLAALWPVLGAEFARKHGAAPGRGAVVLAMGSLGARRLHAGSDLDLIVVYDAQGVEASTGLHPLATRAYFARLTQALVTALAAPMAAGRLYEVDMRLRPSGRQGPVATSFNAFRAYQQAEAWTWEHLALTRARPMAGDASLQAEVEAFRRHLLAQKAGGARVRRDVADMRARLFLAKPALGRWDARGGPGRLMDIEMTAQLAALLTASPSAQVAAQLQAGANGAVLSAADATTLMAACRLEWAVLAATRLLTAGDLDVDRLGDGARAFLLRETGAPTPDRLSRDLDAAATAAAAVIAALLDAGPRA